MRQSPGPTKPTVCSESEELALSIKTNTQWEEPNANCEMSREKKTRTTTKAIPPISGVSYMNQIIPFCIIQIL